MGDVKKLSCWCVLLMGVIILSLPLVSQIKPEEIAARLARAIGEIYSDSHLELSQNFEAVGKYKEALYYYKKYCRVKETICKEKNSRKIAGLGTRFEVEKKEKEIALQKGITYFLIIFSGLILFMTFLIYTRWRLKTRNTLELEREIAEHKRTERILRDNEEKYRALAEKSAVGICVVRDNTIKYANPSFLRIFGYPAEEIIDKHPLELVAEEDVSQVTENLGKRMAGPDDAISYEFKGYTKTGHIIDIESHGSLTQYEGEPALLETVIDVTDRKRVEMEILKTRKLEAIGILAGGIAHDFNNLFTVIIGNISRARSNLERQMNDSRNYTLLENAERASYQVTELAQKFIIFSKGCWISPRIVSLSNILTGTLDLNPEIAKLHYDLSIPDELRPLYGDKKQLKQVFANLLLNASEAMPGHNKDVSIKAENIYLFPGNKCLLKEGDYIKISIIDRGKGIPSHQLEKIFDPYFTTKNTMSQKGLGLGLAICYAIVKKHEGHILVNSEVGKGTTVDIYLPVS